MGKDGTPVLDYADKPATTAALKATTSVPRVGKGPDLGGSSANAAVSDVLKAKEDVLSAFGKHGLWVRSIQMKNCQCLTNPGVELPDDMSVGGLYADSWTLAHPQVPQYFFQMHPEDGKRAVALIVDWKKTADRYVEYSLRDMSSNKTFADGRKRKKPGETHIDMTNMLAELTEELQSGRKIEHNEVRTVQIDKSALVGLLWNPILNPTALSDGGVTWDETKPKFQKFAEDLLKRKVPLARVLPIFSYQVEGKGMTLRYEDHIVPERRR